MADSEKREKPPVEGWRKPVLDADTAARLKEILHLHENDDLPEKVWLMLALHLAVNRYLVLGELDYGALCRICLDAQQYRVPEGRNWIKPGWIITIKSERKEAYYICRGPFGMHLVNKFGMFQLVNPEDIDVTAEGVIDSKVNEQNRTRESAIRATQNLKPLAPVAT
jgi:hypothetical protein